MKPFKMIPAGRLATSLGSVAAVLALLAALPGTAAAQQAPAPAGSAPRTDSEVGRAAADSLYHAGNTGASLAAFRRLVAATDSADARLFWQAARTALAAGWVVPLEDQSIALYREAQTYARRAVAIAPDDGDALYWLAAALGRHAQIEDDPRTAVALAHETHDVALRLLTLQPGNAAAHNIIGQIHYQVMKTPWPLRVLGLRLLGARIRFDASWQLAEQHLLRAVTLDPGTVAFRLELARLYLRTGRHDRARPHLVAATELPRAHPQDTLFQDEAHAMLAALR